MVIYLIGSVWIIGDSLVRRAECPLGLSVRVLWKGRGGAHISHFRDLMSDLTRKSPPPALLIVHLGTNDIVAVDEFALRMQISVLLHDVVLLMPKTIDGLQ